MRDLWRGSAVCRKAHHLGPSRQSGPLPNEAKETVGVILDLGSSGTSLWFSGSGTYTNPAGEFSTLADVSGGGYIRTLTDGTVYRFNSSGQETSVADRNGLRTTFGYYRGVLTARVRCWWRSSVAAVDFKG